MISNHVFPQLIAIPLMISVLLLNLFSIFVTHNFTFLYYVIWLGVFGFLFLKYQGIIGDFLVRIHIPHFLKFVILGYGSVFLEEVIVALVHALTEGFSLSRFFELVSQFYIFNFIAFTGFILCWYFLIKYIRYSKIDLFLIVGMWGLFSEHVFGFIFSNFVMGMLLVLPTMSTYNLIIAPALLGAAKNSAKEISVWKRYVYSFLILFISSIPFIVLLVLLRSHFPAVFPSCEYIPCGFSK